ncbi:hypothetical protein D8Y20_11490 [Mariprofundus sp. EBB-1]|uniref:patatin-like phospholipase family protein n=1 Tax=Mariprofundus sp. EBB-1 TaxID=2650971 RepID=UPI000EF2540B|nr:patatin-like phospholipase family protein [Mariprofundus sp. EBB-1]RLL50652.1 hypothetical protein D8Y20_11490 [Mariprofundus sp. EBB-1]
MAINRKKNKAARKDRKAERKELKQENRNERKSQRQENRGERKELRQENRNERKANRPESIKDRVDQFKENRSKRKDLRQENRADRKELRQENKAERKELKQEQRRERKDQVYAKVWRSTDPNYVFPEKKLLDKNSKKKDVAICFSGGGTRSASASVGQMRALHRLKLNEQVRYISCISGGAWFAIPYTFLPTGISDDHFLGHYFPPEECTIENFNQESIPSIFTKQCIAESEVLTAETFELIYGRTGKTPEKDETYGKMIREAMLEPVGLGHEIQRFVTLSDETRDAILNNNDNLTVNDFDVVRNEDRPFLIAGSCLMNKKHMNPWRSLGHNMFNNEKLATPFLTKFNNEGVEDFTSFPFYLFEFTPMYVGSYRHYVGDETNGGISIGGGYIEPVGFDAEPKGPIDANNMITVKHKDEYNRLSLQDYMASSGAAPAYHALFITLMLNRLLIFKRAASLLRKLFPQKTLPIKPLNPSKGSGKMLLTLMTRGLPEWSGNISRVILKDLKISSDTSHHLLKMAIKMIKPMLAVFPRYQHWSFEHVKKPASTEQSFGDGGYLDNYGIIPVVRRKVKNLVIFMNTNVPLYVDKVKEENIYKNILEIDAGIRMLFGEEKGRIKLDDSGRRVWEMNDVDQIPSLWAQGKNHIFDNTTEDNDEYCNFSDTVNGLLEAQATGGAVTFEGKYRVIDNEFHGIKGGWDVNILWIYNSMCNKWRERLPVETKALLDYRSDMRNFPHFSTGMPSGSSNMDAGKGEGGIVRFEPIDLSLFQSEMLANLSAWSVLEVEDKLKRFFNS